MKGLSRTLLRSLCAPAVAGLWLGAVASCSLTEAADEAGDEVPALQNLNGNGRLFAAPAPQLELKPLLDQKGMVMAYIPLPQSWDLQPSSPGKHTITAPGGVVVRETKAFDYAAISDPVGADAMRRAGKQIAPVMSMDQILTNGVAPGAAAEGFSLVGSYPLPAVQRFWEVFASAMPNTGTQRTYNVAGADFADGNGNRSMVVIVQMILRQPDMVLWSVYTTRLEAPGAAFESAKKTWLDGLAHTQMNEEWQRAMGAQLTEQMRRTQEESRRWMEISAAAHRQRMADIAASGRTSRSVGEINSEILDINQAGYEARSGMNDAGHASTVDMIREEVIVTNPGTGQRYKVSGGHRYYWGDGQGGYFGTNDPNYDPRTDPNMNGRQWVRYATP